MADASELQRAFDEFGERPFPRGSPDDELSDIHAEVAEYDGYVAGLVTTLLGGGNVEPDRLKRNDGLRERAQAVASSDDTARATQAREYVDYLDALHRLVEAARTYAGAAG